MTTPRDYAAEMRVVIDSAIDRESYNYSVLAKEIVTDLQENDPDLLQGWLRLGAENLLRVEIVKIDQLRRQAARIRSSKSVFRPGPVDKLTEQGKRQRFSKAAAQFEESGDSEELDEFTGWLGTKFKVRDRHHRLAEMNGAEVTVAADHYRDWANGHLMQEAFLRGIAKVVGSDGIVKDHYTNETLDQLWQSIKS